MTTTTEAEQAVETSRSRLDETMEAIKDKMTPGQLLDEATRTLGGVGQKAMAKLGEQARENPLPMALIGLGVAWLVAGHYRDDAPTAGPDAASRLKQGAASASDMAAAAKDRLGEAGAGAVDAARSATGKAADLAGTTADQTVAYGRRAKAMFEDLLEREPLLVGGLALLAGFALGSSLPTTALEDKAVGMVSEKGAETAKVMAMAGLDRVEEAARSAHEHASEMLQDAVAGKDAGAELNEADEAAEGLRKAATEGVEAAGRA